MEGGSQAVRAFKRLKIVISAVALALLVSACGGAAEQQQAADNLKSPVDLVLASTENGDRIFILNGLQGSLAIYNPKKGKFVRGATDDEDSPYFFEPFLFDLDSSKDGRLLISCAERGMVYVFDPSTKERKELKLNTNPVHISCSLSDDICALIPTNEQKILILTMDDLKWNEYQLGVLPILALIVGQNIYYFCTDEIAVASVSSPDVITSEISIIGVPQAMVYSEHDKSIYLATSDSSKLWIFEPESQALDVVDLPERAFATSLVDVEGELYLVGAEGSVYAYLKDKKRFCGSSATRPAFVDQGIFSDPEMSEVSVRDCLVGDEKWKVEYDQKERAYTVEGEKSGRQMAMAYEDQTYFSDTGAISFVIHSGDYHTTDGDRFEFSTEAGIAAMKVGLMPRAAIAWFKDDEDKDKQRWLIFVANALSDSISVIDTKKHKVTDMLE